MKAECAAHVEPLVAFGFDLASYRCRAGEHRAGVGEEIAVGGERGEIRHGPTDVARDELEKRFCRRGEEADVEAAVQEQRRDAGAFEDVLQIVGRAPLPFERLLKLYIQRRELFVETLKLLF